MLNYLKKAISWVDNLPRLSLINGLINWWDKGSKNSKFCRWIFLLVIAFISINLLLYFFIFCIVGDIVQKFSFWLLLSCSTIFILLMASHEIGHLIVAKLCSVPTRGIIFLPFFGAAALVYKEKLSQPLSRFKDFLFSIAGSIASWIILFLIIKFTGRIDCLEIIVFCWLSISLFNLLPIYPMDGGRVFLDLIGGLKRRTAATRIVGLILWIFVIIVVGLTIEHGSAYIIVLTIILLLFNYIFLFHLGRIDPADLDGAPMKPVLLILSVIVYGATILGYLYLFKLIIPGGAL